MVAADPEIDWLDEALAEGWTEADVYRIAATATALRTVPTFIHRDVIVLEREPVRSPYAAPGARFVELREQGTAAGIRRANDALQQAGMEQAA